MPRLVLLIALSLIPLGWSRHGHAQVLAPAAACESAIAWAERSETLPRGLLGAIARVESGRVDPADAAVRPWPWTINANGIGRVFDTEDAAIEAVRALRGQGVRSIDVGCLQVNLLYHPTAFGSLEQAFDPTANAAYAARFLRTLFDESQDWRAAAAAYHSRTPDLGASYRVLVLAAWAPGTASPIGWPVMAQAAPPPLSHPVAWREMPARSGTDVLAGSETAARLLAEMPDCPDAVPQVVSPWVVRARSPACGRSPFASVLLLRRALSDETR